jgi:hypothetical protein
MRTSKQAEAVWAAPAFWIFPHGGGCEFLLLRAAVTTKNAISDLGLAIRAAPRVTQGPR